METLESKKLRGGYYTPQVITDFITNWVIQNEDDHVLEPSCGDGAFIESSIKRFLSIGSEKSDIAKHIHAIEYNSIEAEKARNRFTSYGIKPYGVNITEGDFFQYCKSNLSDKIQFDGIVGNPPFIRYQDFPEDQRQPAFSLMIRAGLKPTRLTNTWIPFLVASTLLLKDNGRIGMVIPAELFQVNYAAETRRFLSESFSTLLIITFRQLVFSDVQQEVVILLGEKDCKYKHGIKIIEVTNIGDLNKLDLSNFERQTVELDHSSEKWIQYYLTKKEIDLLRKIRADSSIPLTGEYIDVDVGIVTGQNKFFVIRKEIIEKYGLENYVVRIIGKSSQIKGMIATESDWRKLASNNYPVYLLNITEENFDALPKGVKEYLDLGISYGFEKGYKCRIRKNWWVVPSVWVPDAFMLRQVHLCPKIVLNNCKATATDTLHRVKLINGMSGSVLSCAFVNSLTLAFAEVTGRSYGGGVLTFEPSEAERLPLPVKNAENLDIVELDSHLRSNNLNNVLDKTDEILLRDGLKLSDTDIASLRSIWKKLSSRRVQRRSNNNVNDCNQLLI